MADSEVILGCRQLDAEDIELIALGAGVLGSGGGGSAYLGHLLARRAVRHGRPITLIPADSLPRGALVIGVAQVGAPVVLAERLARGTEAADACALLERYVGETAAAVACLEIGGVNSMIPLLAAAQRGLPLLDADGMGRAFPGLHQHTLAIYGAAAPIVLCDDEGNATICSAADAAATERLGRAATAAMGGLAYMATPVPRGIDPSAVLIPGSYSRAYALGLALRQAERDGDLRALALAPVGGRLLFCGVIQAVERHAPDDPTSSALSIAGQGDGYTGIMRIAFQTEYLLAWHDGELRAATPDAIAVVDEETGEPISAEALRIGPRVAVLHLDADARLTTLRALERVGPAAFGYAAAYRWADGRP